MKKTPSKILAADDDLVVRKLLAHHFERHGLGVEVAIVDLRMPGMDGRACLRAIKERSPGTEVILLTSFNDAREAVGVLKDGAFDYITKPFDPEEVVLSVRRARSLAQAREAIGDMRAAVGFGAGEQTLLGQSEAFREVERLLPRIAPSENTVLITGASGTGKGVLARVIHARSPRAQGPFVAVSCPSLPRDLIESEMFGHERCAFSGASQRRLGRAELADGGTLFLDEIGELPLELQPKLLTFLQERSFYRLGGEAPISVDVRVIAATNRDLSALVRAGTFREDLYYRLNVLALHMPPLAERSDDVLLLARSFLALAAARERVPVPELAPEAEEALRRHPWPGNIRELENVIARAFTFRADPSRLSVGDLPPTLRAASAPDAPASPAAVAAPAVGAAEPGTLNLQDVEKRTLALALRQCGGNKAKTARVLGVSEKSVYNMMARHGLV